MEPVLASRKHSNSVFSSGDHDLVRKYCFKPPKSKESVSSCLHIWPARQLRFLLYRGSDWSLHEDDNRFTMKHHYYHTLMTKAATVDGDSLSSHWLSSLNEMVIDASWDALHTNYSRLVEPWTASVPGSGAIFQKIPFVGVATGAQCGIDVKAKQTALGMQELHDFISLYQRIRQVRAEALAAELYRLANMYDEYPEFLKQPLAPKTQRLNKQHIPTGMRNEARKMTKKIVHASWRYGERYKYHFAFPFPGLVPYDWTLQLFKEVVEKSAVSDLPHRKGIAENIKVVHDGLPTWTLGANEQVNRWAPENTKDMQTPGTTPEMW